MKKGCGKLLGIITILCGLCFSLSSCTEKSIKVGGEKKADQKTHKLTLGFSIDTLAIERWQRDLDVFMNRVRDLGAEVIVQNAGNSIEVQNKQLMYLLDKEVDVVVVLPKETDSLTESLQKIKAKNIPIISYDRLIRNTDIDLYLSINSREVGELMAKNLQHYTSGHNWFCILGAKEDYNMTLILDGINSVCNHTPYFVSYIFNTAGWNYDLAYQEMVRLIKENRIPDAIVCGNDAVADSVISALELYYPEKHIPICGQDADIVACQNIVNGKQEFTVYKPIIQLAETAAEMAVGLAKGKSVDELITSKETINNGLKNVPVYWLEPKVVTKQNIDAVIIDSGFHTRGEVYKDN